MWIIPIFLLAPAGVLWLCKKIPVLGKIGPVLVLYILGIIIGNIFHPACMAQVQDLLSSAMVPLAIPLMLFSCKFSRSQTRSQLLALITGMVAVVAAVIIGFLIFGKGIPDGAKVGGMLTGVYTGGTINLAALKSMLNASEETFILLNSYDMIICFLYLTFLMGFGIKLFRKWLPNITHPDNYTLQDGENASSESAKPSLFSKAWFKDAAVLFGIDILIIGVSAGVALLCGDDWFMTVLILLLTTLGIAASFWKPVRDRKSGYDIGMYLIYIFSIVVASMADLSKFELDSSLALLGYLTFVIFGSLAIQVFLAKIFGIDADTMTVSSVTYICSPPFVPMIAGAMKNSSILAGGLAIGVVGYAVGNYLGFILFQLLSLL